MMDMNGDLLPGQPSRDQSGNGMSNKELLLELRIDVKDLKSKVDVMCSQNHDQRIDELEKWKDRADGRMDTIVKGIPLIAAVVSIITGLAGFIALHFTGVV